jgi:hypothetical protein
MERSSSLTGFYLGLSRYYQERALPAELCGPPAFYSGGGRI